MSLSCLIVDDNTAFLASVTRLFASQGVDVVGLASTGAEALRLMRQLRPDVVLVDVELGKEDGVDLARRMTSTGRSSTRVILISIRDRDELAELIGGCGAAGFLRKDTLNAQMIADLAG